MGLRLPEVRLVLLWPVWKGDTLDEQKRPYKLMGEICSRVKTATWCSTSANTAWARSGSGARRSAATSWRTAGDIGANPAGIRSALRSMDVRMGRTRPLERPRLYKYRLARVAYRD